MTAVGRCENCGSELVLSGRGRPKRTCSDACRKALQRRPAKPTRLPARGYSWEPFAPGHKLSVRHGASSQELVAARTGEIRAEYLERFPHLTDRDEMALDLFFTNLARYRMMDSYWAEVASGEREAWPAKGRPRSGPEAVPPSVHEQMTRLAGVLGRQAHQLGLDPLGFGQLAKDSAVFRALTREQQLQSLLAKGREVRRARGDLDAEDAEDAE